jgi:hypothetical protein
MPKLTKFTLRDGQTIWVEVDDETEDEVGRYRRVAREKGSDLAKTATQSLQSALEAIKPAAEELAATLQSLARRPSDVEIEFGLKLSGESPTDRWPCSTRRRWSATASTFAGACPCKSASRSSKLYR